MYQFSRASIVWNIGKEARAKNWRERGEKFIYSIPSAFVIIQILVKLSCNAFYIIYCKHFFFICRIIMRLKIEKILDKLELR